VLTRTSASTELTGFESTALSLVADRSKSRLRCFILLCSPSQWPSGLRRGSSAERLLAFRVRVLPGSQISVSCECCVLSGRGLCDGLITRPEQCYRV
jgi:hypothetical protein